MDEHFQRTPLARNVPVLDVGLRRPTLDDVFLTLTGHTAEEKAEGDSESDGGPAGTPELTKEIA